MTEIEKSSKLIFNEFQRAISEVPLEVFYQYLYSDQYSANGFQFNIKSPGSNALLDCDVWIKYIIKIKGGAADLLVNMFEDRAGGSLVPQSDVKLALRSGNVMQRAIQNLSLQLNNQTLNVQPYRWIDQLNRIYISNDQSEHEFSASGGRFDEGNHGVRTSHVVYKNQIANANAVPNLFLVASGVALATNTHADIYLHDVWHTDGAISNVATRDFLCNMRPPYPVRYDFYNPGFSSRVDTFASKARQEWSTVAEAAANAAAGVQFTSQVDGANQYIYTITLWERLPMPIFKMYSTDGNYGVIPNIHQMVIQGNFVTQLKQNLFRCSDANYNFDLYWTGISNQSCIIYLRWFTPPASMSIPRELSIPYHKINHWSKSVTINARVAAERAIMTDVDEYNITLEAIPDLLLIYVKYRPTSATYTMAIDDDFLLEIQDLMINIDNASGKLNQIQTIDLYQKWKKIIKHQDAKIIGFDEWRKYCCIAALQPEDYGVRYGPGYSNQTVLGVKFKAWDYHNNVSIMVQPEENNAGAGRDCDLHIVSIYNKNRLIIRADGTASQEMTKVSADFNMMQPLGAPLGEEIRGRLI